MVLIYVYFCCNCILLLGSVWHHNRQAYLGRWVLKLRASEFFVKELDYSSLNKDAVVPHPQTGDDSYGYISNYKSRNMILPSGEIYLRVGKHFGMGKGFGVNLIWGGHAHELPRWGCRNIHEVPSYVASILTSGAQVLCEFHQTREGYRLTVVRGSKGCVILSPQRDAQQQNFYSVITAYKAHRNRDATNVGTLKTKKAP